MITTSAPPVPEEPVVESPLQRRSAADAPLAPWLDRAAKQRGLGHGGRVQGDNLNRTNPATDWRRCWLG